MAPPAEPPMPAAWLNAWHAAGQHLAEHHRLVRQRSLSPTSSSPPFGGVDSRHPTSRSRSAVDWSKVRVFCPDRNQTGSLAVAAGPAPAEQEEQKVHDCKCRSSHQSSVHAAPADSLLVPGRSAAHPSGASILREHWSPPSLAYGTVPSHPTLDALKDGPACAQPSCFSPKAPLARDHPSYLVLDEGGPSVPFHPAPPNRPSLAAPALISQYGGRRSTISPPKSPNTQTVSLTEDSGWAGPTHPPAQCPIGHTPAFPHPLTRPRLRPRPCATAAWRPEAPSGRKGEVSAACVRGRVKMPSRILSHVTREAEEDVTDPGGEARDDANCYPSNEEVTISLSEIEAGSSVLPTSRDMSLPRPHPEKNAERQSAPKDLSYAWRMAPRSTGSRATNHHPYRASKMGSLAQRVGARSKIKPRPGAAAAAKPGAILQFARPSGRND